MKNEDKRSILKLDKSPLGHSKKRLLYLEEKYRHCGLKKDASFKGQSNKKEQSKSQILKEKYTYVNTSIIYLPDHFKEINSDIKTKLPSLTIKKIALNKSLKNNLPSTKEDTMFNRFETNAHISTNHLNTLSDSSKNEHSNTNTKNQNEITDCIVNTESIIQQPKSKKHGFILSSTQLIAREKEIKDNQSGNISFRGTDEQSKDNTIRFNIQDQRLNYSSITVTKSAFGKQLKQTKRKKTIGGKRNNANTLFTDDYHKTTTNFQVYNNWKKNVSPNHSTLTRNNINKLPKMYASSPINYRNPSNNTTNTKRIMSNIDRTFQKNKSFLSKLTNQKEYNDSIYSNNNNSHIDAYMNKSNNITNSYLINTNKKETYTDNYSKQQGLNMRYHESHYNRNLQINLPYSNTHTDIQNDDSSSFIQTNNKLSKTFNMFDEISDDITNSTSQNTNNRTFNIQINKTRKFKPTINSYSVIRLGEKRLKTDSSFFISDISKSFSSNKTEVFDLNKDNISPRSPDFGKDCSSFFSSSEISIKVLSTWGNTKWFRIKKIELLGKSGESIEILKMKYNDVPIDHKQYKDIDESLPIGHYDLNNTTIKIYYSSLKEIKSLSIWNYNGSDTSVGIKDIEISRRHLLIWKGQVTKGIYNISLDQCQLIQFNSIELLSEVDESEVQRTKLKQRFDTHIDFLKTMSSLDTKKLKLKNVKRKSNKPTLLNKETSHNTILKKQNTMTSERPVLNSLTSNILNVKIKKPLRKKTQAIQSIKCKKIKIILKENYGDRKHIGLTGLQIINNLKEIINIESAEAIGALPKDISTYFCNNDTRIFENLFNGINETIDDSLMWLTMFQAESNNHPFIEIAFGYYISISSIVFWNYNKGSELDKGVKQIELLFDDITYDDMIILRKGIGEDNVDYKQEISFPFVHQSYTEEELDPFKMIKYASLIYNQHYETPYLPTGFIFKFIFISNWGDKQFIGVNSIMFYDQLGKKVTTTKKSIKILSFPNDLKHRSINNHLLSYYSSYVDFRNAITFDPSDTFSTFKLIKSNVLYVLFDRPVSISYIQITNYTIPEIGVRQMIIYCDDKMIFDGEISKSEYKFNKGETVLLFTCDLSITKSINENLLPNQKKNMKYKTGTYNNSLILCND